MPRQMTEKERQEFLAEPRVGVLGVPIDDERPPLTVPVWYGYRAGSNLTFFTRTQGRRGSSRNRACQPAGPAPEIRPRDAWWATRAAATTRIRRYLARRGIDAVIPLRYDQGKDASFDSEICRERNKVERLVGGRLKQWRRIATR